MREMLAVTQRWSPGIGESIGLITDGRFSGGTMPGRRHVAPEAWSADRSRSSRKATRYD